MKISIIHSYYAELGNSGENNVVDAQISVLMAMGHQVMIYSNSTVDEQKSKLFQLRAASNVIFGIGNNPEKDLDKFQPDVILMHNLFPNISTKWLEKYGPITYSFKHNYRDICASANLYRNKSICLKCVDGSSYNGVRFRCYKNSAIMSLPLAIRNSCNLESRRDLTKPKKLLVLSRHMKKIMMSTGLMSEKFEVIPNFVQVNYKDQDLIKEKNGRWIAAGRLSDDKGFRELLQVWPEQYNLDIYGDGPLLTELNDIARTKKNIQIKGSIERKKLLELLPEFEGGIIASRLFEPGPLIILEYLAAGLPIISLGSWSEAAGLDEEFHIETSVNSESNESQTLKSYLLELTKNRETYSQRQRDKYLADFTPVQWYKKFLNILSVK